MQEIVLRSSRVAAVAKLPREPAAPYYAAHVLLTRIWGVILACLATFFLAGMFLVATGGDEDFTDADRAAVRAITEAGLAALEAQVAASPV